MTWRQDLQNMKQDLHATFASPARYTPVNGYSYDVEARLHRKTDTIGEGDGYAQMIIEVDRVILMVDQIRDDPERGDTVYFHDEKVTAQIDTVEPPRGVEIVCNVILTDGQV